MRQKKTFVIAILMFVLALIVTMGYMFGAVDSGQWKEGMLGIAVFGTSLVTLFAKSAMNRIENKIDQEDK